LLAHLTDQQRHLIVFLHQKMSQGKIVAEVGFTKTGVNATIKR